MQLRAYQKEQMDLIFKAWAEGYRKVMAQLSTGGGKTILFSYIARSFVEEGQGVMVIAHRKELIVQAKDKLEAITGLECGVIKAGYPAEYHKDIQVASIQSLSRRKHRPDVGLVIFDEAHHCSSKTYSDIIEQYPNAYILGVTATPCRTDGQGFQFLFDELIPGVCPKQLMADGYLCPFKLYGAKPISTKGVRTTAGDFNQKQLEDRAMALIGDVYPSWEKHAEGLQTIIFAVSVAHSKKIVEQFEEQGINAEHIDGTTPDKEREEIIERFRNRETMVLSNVGIFTEGFDLPTLEAVQVVRPTMSLSLHLQMLGRGLRPAVDEGKEYCVFIDHSDNWSEHGLPDEDRVWSLLPKPLKKSRYTQQCPKCNHVFQPLSHEHAKPTKKFIDENGLVTTLHISTCPNCRHKFEWEQGEGGEGGGRTAKQDHGDIVEVDVNTTSEGLRVLRELIQIQESTGKKKGWIYYQALKMPESYHFSLGDWRYLAKHLGYKEAWAYKALQEAKQKYQQLSLPVD